MTAVARLLSLLPFWVLYGISDFVFFIGYYVIRYRRKVVWGNLSRSFPEKNHVALRKIEKQFYHNLCDYAVETLKLLTVSRKELARRVVYKNLEGVHRYTDAGQSVIFFASHQFNWEWLLATWPLFSPVPVDFVYQAQASKTFDQILLACRTRFGQYPIQREKVAREVTKRRRVVRVTAIAADQFPGLGSDKRYWTKFLNQDTAFFLAVNQLPLLTQYPAFYAHTKKVRQGYYEIELVAIGTPPYDKGTFHIADKYAQALEGTIARYPDNWLWSHKRWKYPRPSGE